MSRAATAVAASGGGPIASSAPHKRTPGTDRLSSGDRRAGTSPFQPTLSLSCESPGAALGDWVTGGRPLVAVQQGRGGWRHCDACVGLMQGEGLLEGHC